MSKQNKMFAIAKQTKLGYKYLEFIDATGAKYYTYDVRSAMKFERASIADKFIIDNKLTKHTTVPI